MDVLQWCNARRSPPLFGAPSGATKARQAADNAAIRVVVAHRLGGMLMRVPPRWFCWVALFAAPAAWAADAPTAPLMVSADKISAGDTAWMLTSTALVLMMSIPGLALFYGGMVRKKNVLATLMQTFAIVCLVTLLWWLVGYSLAFTPGGKLLGGFSRAFF